MRKPHVLKGIARNTTPEYIIYYDTESYVETEISPEEIDRALNGEKVTKPHKLYLIVACFKRKREQWKVYTEENGLNHSFWGDVVNFGGKRKKTVWVIAHNARYDTIVSDGVRELVKRGYKVYAFSDDNPFFIKLENEQTGKKLILMSSTNIFKNSLRELGEIFGIKKGEIDYAGEELEKAVEYCRTDVEILKEAMEKYIQFIKDENLGNFSITVAGQAFNAYRYRFMTHDIYIHSNGRAITLEREAYAGGRTEAFKVGEIRKKVYCYDVNSMYPYIMKKFLFPTRLLTVKKKLTFDEARDLIEKGYLIISRCKIRTEKPVFFKKAGKLIFPVGTFTTTLSTPELIYGIEHRLITEIGESAIYEAGPIFRGYVDYFYNKRLEAKANKDKVRDLLFKLFLNSLYGKFGQKSYDWEIIEECDPAEIGEERILDMDTGKRYTVKKFGGHIFKRNDDEFAESFNSFPAIAAHVTAYARMTLWNYMEIAGQENVYYCDTDSLFVNEEGRKRLESSGVVDGKKLGALKLEKEADLLVIHGVKDYVFGDKVKMKGINKGAVKIDDNHYAVVIWRGLSKYIKNGFTTGYENEVMIKELRREYDKGYISNGKVYPLVMEGDKIVCRGLTIKLDNRQTLIYAYKNLLIL